jgi:molybdopterin-containing oxidoreductase family membrane subunit
MLFAGVLIEKSLGAIIPGFLPEPWGKIPRHVPTWVEIAVTAGLWALGAFVLTVLAKAAIPIELRRAGSPATPAEAGS